MHGCLYLYPSECKILLFLALELYTCLSSLPGSCQSPPHVAFAKLSEEDEMKNFYAVGITVSYDCSPGYENSTAELPSSTCRENSTWSEVAELCHSECLCILPSSFLLLLQPQHRAHGCFSKHLARNTTTKITSAPLFLLLGALRMLSFL